MVHRHVVAMPLRKPRASAALLALASSAFSAGPLALRSAAVETDVPVAGSCRPRGAAKSSRSSVAMNALHIRLPKPKNVKAQTGMKEYKFDEDGGLYDIIKYPLLTEKACRLIEEHNTYTFRVDRRANKPQIRAAIETIFDVQVEKCNTLIPLAKYTVKFGKKIGRKSLYKKVYCRLKPGYSIDLFPDDPDALNSDQPGEPVTAIE